MSESPQQQRERSKKGLETTRSVYPILKEGYHGAYKAKQEGRLVAWVTAYSPVEILYAMDVVPVFPENYAALISAKQRAPGFCEAAEKEGYSKDLCSYFRADIGSVLLKQSVLSHEMPAPDILITTTSICDAHLKWFETLQKEFGCPLFMLDFPYNQGCGDAPDVDSTHVDYSVGQMRDLIFLLERLGGNTLDWGRLQEAVLLSDRTSQFWIEICELRKAIPSPMSAVDAFSDIAIMMTQAGTWVAVNFFMRLRDEVKTMVEQGQGTITEERYRLLWDNVAMWYDMKLFNYLESKGAVVVIEYFNLGWACRLDPNQPLESLSRKYLSLAWGNSPLDRKFDKILTAVRDYRVNGAIIFSNWGCRPYCIGQLELKKVLQSKLKLPSLIIDGDIADPRNFSEAPLLTRIDAFIESLN